LRTIEKVYFNAKLLGATNPLSEQEAEQLITYAALYGKDWEEGRNIVDLAQASCSFHQRSGGKIPKLLQTNSE